ncbi:MAG: UDP-N-acetylmuramoyl-L-alanyl-D-glutamate--2,6-diaminopimelate ligase, partial [Clostridia bacterium]|nr:UDP-N-acetylmuramoyl-L-alanyl-D-glutamate--2,6-diaminopimelate ligase [Clostridia bacterium]
MSFTLCELLENHLCTVCGDASAVTVTRLEYDSRKAADSGTLFFCMPGARLDGHDYAARVYEAGCRAFVVEHTVDLPADAVQVIVKTSRESLALLSAKFYGNPAGKLQLIGITGTKGKTT